VAADLATAAGLAAVEEATRDLEVGLVVVNAAYSPIGRLIDQGPDPAGAGSQLPHAAGGGPPAPAGHGRSRPGGLIIMSSLAGL
jgi:hypothetical protein